MSKNNFFFKIFTLFPSLKKNYFKLIFISIFCSFLDLISIGMVAPIVGLVMEPNFIDKLPYFQLYYEYIDEKNILNYLLFFFLTSFFFKSILSYQIFKKIFKYCYTEQSILRQKILKLYLEAPFQTFLKKDFQSKYASLTELTRISSEDALINFLRISSDSVILLFIFFFFLFLNFKITFVLFLFFISLFLCYKFFLKKKIYHIGKDSIQSLKNIIKNSETTLNSLKEIKVFQKESFFIERMKLSSDLFSTAMTRRIMLSYFPKYLIEVLFVTIIVLSIYFLGLESDSKNILPLIATMIIAILRIAPLIFQLLGSISLLWNSAYAIDEVLKIQSEDFFINSKKIIKKENKSFTFFNSTIKFKNFSFKYNKNPIFKDLSFEIKKKKIFGIFGESGSGKTTLIHLIIGLLKVQNGTISVDKKIISNKSYSLIGSVAYIPQDPILLDESIKDNIIFDNKFESLKFKNVVKMAYLSKFIDQLPNKENSKIGHMGSLISGGQRQRIAIARALYADKSILILDEPTSSLDINSKNKILNTIKEISINKTLIIISHDLSLKRICNNVIEI
jgi:ABC-type multidrug transport system fused ATPase/permease subunit